MSVSSNRRQNPTTKYFELEHEELKRSMIQDVNWYPKSRLRDVYVKRENELYRTGQPTMPKFVRVTTNG